MIHGTSSAVWCNDFRIHSPPFSRASHLSAAWRPRGLHLRLSKVYSGLIDGRSLYSVDVDFGVLLLVLLLSIGRPPQSTTTNLFDRSCIIIHTDQLGCLTTYPVASSLDQVAAGLATAATSPIFHHQELRAPPHNLMVATNSSASPRLRKRSLYHGVCVKITGVPDSATWNSVVVTAMNARWKYTLNPRTLWWREMCHQDLFS